MQRAAHAGTRVTVVAVVLTAFLVAAAGYPTADLDRAMVATTRAGSVSAIGYGAVDQPRWSSARDSSARAAVARPDTGHAIPLEAGSAASTFGVLVVDGGEHQCSAAVVASASRRLLSTAAHCVWLDEQWTLDGAYFVPGFAAGREPWGRWAVEAAWVPRRWQAANSPIEDVASAHDVAFVRLAENSSGELPEDVLGSQGVSFAAPATPTVTAVGYPVAGAFDGQQLERCTGAAHVEQAADPDADSGSAGTQSGGEVLVMACDMTEGASGGPWLVGPRADSGRGQVVGVVSGASGPDLISARFGPEAEDVYRAADTGTDLDDGQ